MSAKEVINDFKENYSKVRKLLDEESKNDPETEPYLSKYKAKEILANMRETITRLRTEEPIIDKIKLDAMLGTVLMNIGVIEMETEDLPACERVLNEAEEILVDNGSKPEIVLVILDVYNHLGILWSNRSEPDKAKSYLCKAKELYESFKCSLLMPQSIDQLFTTIEERNVNEIMLLEKAHTLTLYYLAQVYGYLKDKLKSAILYHVTLRRQLQYTDFDHIDWALNSATLSQFFAEQNGFLQSRHHLAAASTILEQYEEKLSSMENEGEVYLAKVENFKHRSADVARCWSKYCLILMSHSQQRLMSDTDEVSYTITDMSNLSLQDDENICGGDILSLVFPDLDVSKYESKVTDKYLCTYQDAREVFLSCQTWLNKAKEHYKLDTLASDYIELVQDSSASYSHLAFFEEDDERRAKMLKRRVDMLEDLLKEINPTYYMNYCRQLWVELAETYSDILNIKLEKVNRETPNPHLLKKINMLCEKSMENYETFLNTVKDKTGKFPEKLDHDLIRPVVNALAFIGRNSMKRIVLDKSTQLLNYKKSYDSYQAIVDICTKDPEIAKTMYEEYSLCQEMVKILPLKLKKLESEMVG